MLSGSLAYEAGEFLLIDSPIALFGQMIKQEGFVKTLLSVLEQKTGHSYKIRVKKAKKQAASSVNPLDEIARNAQRLGIDVREK